MNSDEYLIFDVNIYKKYNRDLLQFNDNELIEHYYKFGMKEERICSKPKEMCDFSMKIYKDMNEDLNYQEDIDYEIHVMIHGLKEKRIYSVETFLNYFKITLSEIKNKYNLNDSNNKYLSEDICILYNRKRIEEEHMQKNNILQKNNIFENLIINNIDENRKRVKSIINEYVDKIFVINLESRKDRLNKIVDELEKNNINNVKIFKGICPKINIKLDYENILEDYSNKTYDLIEYDWKKTKNMICLQGIVGCKASHIEIIKIAKQNNYDSILILEDDIEFTNNWQNDFENTMISIKNDKINYDILYLTCNHLITYDEINNYLVKPKYGLQTCGYIINSSIYDYIIETAMNSGMTIDVYYCEYIQKNPLYNTYCIMPNIINQIIDFSTIENRMVDYSTITTNKTVVKKDVIIDISNMNINNNTNENIIKIINSIQKYVINYKYIYVIDEKFNIFNKIKRDLNIIFIQNKQNTEYDYKKLSQKYKLINTYEVIIFEHCFI
jgi:glycosyl transferase, family 25